MHLPMLRIWAKLVLCIYYESSVPMKTQAHLHSTSSNPYNFELGQIKIRVIHIYIYIYILFEGKGNPYIDLTQFIIFLSLI